MQNFTKLFLICSLGCALQAMNAQVILPKTGNFYETFFEEGKDTILRFFGTKRGFSSFDEEFVPDELLALVLRSPEGEHNELIPFEDFREYYKGVGEGLKSIEYEHIPEERVPLYEPLVVFCNMVQNAKSYEDILIIHQKDRWSCQYAELATLFQTLTLHPPADQEERLDATIVCQLIAQRNFAVIPTIIGTMDEQIGEGNVTDDDINWMIQALFSLIAIDVSPKEFGGSATHRNFLISLADLSKKTILCKKSPEALYLDDSELCYYHNDARHAAQCFITCLVGAYGLSKGTCITQNYFEALEYLISFMSGISAGLSFTSKTYGRIYALQKLTGFLKFLPNVVTLLKDSDSFKDDLDSLTELLSQSKDLLDQLRQLIAKVTDFNSALLAPEKHNQQR